VRSQPCWLFVWEDGESCCEGRGWEKYREQSSGGRRARTRFLVARCVVLSTKTVLRRVKAMRVKIVAWASVVCWAAVWNCPGRLFASSDLRQTPSAPAKLGRRIRSCLRHEHARTIHRPCLTNAQTRRRTSESDVWQ